jgi:hypothetical protein
MKQELLINEIFEDLVKQLEEILPEFGKRLAIDSKAIPSFAKHQNKNETGDGRGEHDANYGKKKYKGVHNSGCKV